MADYNIYIHNLNDGGGSKTTPWNGSSKPRATKPKEKKGYSDEISVINMIGNPDSIVSSAVSGVVKALPAIAVAFAVIKLSDQIVSTVASFVTAESGDYRFVTDYGNFKSSLSACMRPFTTTINYFKAQQQYRIENAKREMKAELLGDSVINSYMNRGV